jgi:hypothetical protein
MAKVRAFEAGQDPPEEAKEEEEDEDEEQEYVVETLVGRRTKNKILEYRVRWRGYESSDDTWEPRSHLETAMEKVREFDAGQQPCAEDGDEATQKEVEKEEEEEQKQDQEEEQEQKQKKEQEKEKDMLGAEVLQFVKEVKERRKQEEEKEKKVANAGLLTQGVRGPPGPLGLAIA